MVMHARKQPRLNDGFSDRKDTHLHQNLQYESQSLGGGMYGDRYDRRDRHDNRGREGAPSSHQSPRYPNKSSYMERSKEKRGGSSNQWEKSNNQMGSTSSSSGHRGGGYIGSGGGGDRQNSLDRSNFDRSYKNSNSKDQQKEPKDRAEVQKSAVRVFGDWSEHISSSKKRYYYNCRTEVSQWEKPKEWIESPTTPENSRSKDSRNSGKPYAYSSSRANDGSKHSSSSVDRADKYNARGDSVKHPDRFSPSSLDRSKIVYSQTMPDGAVQRTSSLQQRTFTPCMDKDGYSEHRKNSYYSSASCSMADPGRRRQRHESEGSRSSVGHTTPQKNEDPNIVEEMDISPGGTPTAALQTLQKLQQALNMHIARTQQNFSFAGSQNQHPQQHLSPQPAHQPSPHAPPTVTSSTLHPSHPENGSIVIAATSQPSPVSDVSPCHSPVPTTITAPSIQIGTTSALSGASIKKDNSVGLTPSLSNYYSEKLITHVLGWQANHAERQAHRYMEEAMNVGSLHCSQVSVELKKARSLVRVAEIQSTLHEQRILFLDKQISEIDSLKPGTTFLPS